MSFVKRYFHVGTTPFWVIHLICLSAFFVEFQWSYVAIALGSYFVRMFFVTAGYHRYFSHKTYQTSRVFQFVLAFFASATAQKGVLWWAAHHRHHHAHSDMEDDIHSPKEGFWHSHVGWILEKKYDETRYELIRDLTKFPELLWINKWHLIPAVLYAIALTLLFGWVGGLLWGFFISTVLLWHGTFTINSLSHTWGWQRYKTTDTSRNNPILAIVTLGEGWHNNHHRYQASARNGFFWWEYDITYYGLKLLSALRLVRSLRPVPKVLLDPSNESWIQNQLAVAKTALEEKTATVKVALEAKTAMVKEQIDETTEQVKAKIEEQTATVRASIEETTETVKEKARVVGEKAIESADDIVDQVSQKLAPGSQPT